jgi:hypothetical protein
MKYASKLSKVGEGPNGAAQYAIVGAFPFVGIDLTELHHGDLIRDNNGRGMFLYVNVCDSCGTKYLAGMRFFVHTECVACARKYRGTQEAP